MLKILEEIKAQVMIALSRGQIHIEDDAAQLTFGVDGNEAIARAAENVLILQDENRWGRNVGATTLGAGVTTFGLAGEVMVITGDGGANVIATITGGYEGMRLILIFVDGFVTITDNDAHDADSVDVAGAATDFVGADDTVLELIYDGTSWYEMSRSVN